MKLQNVFLVARKKLHPRMSEGFSDETQVTAQDKALVSLCSIDRVLEFVYKYIVYDGPDIKVPRYQQYFAVLNTIERVKEIEM